VATLYAVCPRDHWGEVPEGINLKTQDPICACGQVMEPARKDPSTQGWSPAMKVTVTLGPE
jgi:hypothetical protein